MIFKLSPSFKGLITAAFMIAGSLYIDSIKDSVSSQVQYLIYGLYIAGIVWTLIPMGSEKFSEKFSQGFKCFIIVTLVMVAFTTVFVKMHPEYAEQESIATREYYIKQADKTPSEIEDLAKKAKKQYLITVISISIFRYLIIGAGVTAAASALLTRRNN